MTTKSTIRWTWMLLAATIAVVPLQTALGDAEADKLAAEKAQKDKAAAMAADRAAKEAAARDAQLAAVAAEQAKIVAAARDAAAAREAETQDAPPASRPVVHLRSEGIFVPPPKKETLDSSSKPAAGGRLEQVLTKQGDRLNGKVLEIDAAGNLRLIGSQFAGEVAVAVPSLETVTLASTTNDGGEDQVLLNNKQRDSVAGKITAITAESVTIESAAAGSITISRKVIRGVTFANSTAALLESNFDGGEMAPFKGGPNSSWSVGDEGLLSSEMQGRMNILSGELEQSQPVTLEVKAESQRGMPLYMNLVLFADSANTGNYYGRNSVYAQFQGSECYIGYCNEGNSNSISSRSFNRSVQAGTMRVAYDPSNGKLKAWLDSQEMGEGVVPNGVKSGKCVMLVTQYPCKIKTIRVLPGIVPPGEDTQTKAEAETEVIQFGNQDRVSAKAVTLADGQFVGQTGYGELRCPVEKVQQILFHTKGLEEPRRQKGDVRVLTGQSRLTIQIEKLTGEYLLGKSDYCGEVKILRSAIRQIKFNPYQQDSEYQPAAGGRIRGGGRMVMPQPVMMEE